jgi:hypothetical protein
MKALILYTSFVIVGAVLAGFIGLFLEREFSSTVSLIVFLAMFFANFAVCWIATILVMDGNLANAQGTAEQEALERSARANLASLKNS